MKKLDRSKFIELLGQEWIFLTIGKAVEACNFMLHSNKPGSAMAETDARDNIVWTTFICGMSSCLQPLSGCNVESLLN